MLGEVEDNRRKARHTVHKLSKIIDELGYEVKDKEIEEVLKTPE